MEAIANILDLLLNNDPFFDIILFLSILIVFALIIIIFGLKIFLKFLDKEEDFRKQINENIEKYNTKQNTNINTTASHKPTPELVNAYVKLNTLLKSELKDACIKTHAERIAVYLFHNGTYSLNGFPFIKTSCICEALGYHSNISPFNHIKQTNIPVNILDEFLDDLFHHNIFISSKSNLDLKNVEKILLDRNSHNYFVAISILDKSKIDEPPFGFVLVEFKKDLNEIEQDTLNVLTNVADDAAYTLQVSSLLKETYRKENI